MRRRVVIACGGEWRHRLTVLRDAGALVAGHTDRRAIVRLEEPLVDVELVRVLDHHDAGRVHGHVEGFALWCEHHLDDVDRNRIVAELEARELEAIEPPAEGELERAIAGGGNLEVLVGGVRREPARRGRRPGATR